MIESVEGGGEGSHLGPAAGSQLSDELKIVMTVRAKLELSRRAQPAGRPGQNARTNAICQSLLL